MVAHAAAGCVRGSRTDGGSSEGSTTCPAAEPGQRSDCAVAVGRVCTYRLAAVRTVHCHCVGTSWDCGPPLGIDSLSDAPDCPAQAPTSGTACTLQGAPPAPGVRPGCRYQVAATPIVHDCACAHFESDDPRWDCGPRVGDAPVDARGCPAREPVARSLCTGPTATQCQYGYNLSTTCECLAPEPGDPRQWRCRTSPQPPSPGPLPGP